MKNLIFARHLFFLLSLTIFFNSVSSLKVNAQTCSTQNSPRVVQNGFPRGTAVQVFIDPARFTTNQINAIKTAFNNWQAASSTNNSNVSFTFVTTQPAAGTYQWLIGHEAPVVNPGTRAESGTTAFDTGGNAQQAVTIIDPRVTDPAAILEVMSHEIGHPMGLDDCLTCSPTDSTMAPGPNPSNPNFWNAVVGRPTGPTPCDSQNLQQGNYPICTPPVNTTCDGGYWDSSMCSCAVLGGGGGGGGVGGGGGTFYPDYPGPSFCTPYYWVYYESWDNGETWQMVDYSYAGCF